MYQNIFARFHSINSLLFFQKINYNSFMKKVCLISFLMFVSVLLGASSYEYLPRREFVPNYKYGYKKAKR